MQHLRKQVDQTDSKILQLLQQRIKLSSRIGAAKRLARAVVFVPERERQLLAEIERRCNGKFPPGAIGSIYREIISSSRAAQGQKPIGLLEASAPQVMLPGRWRFGACDRFEVRKSWSAVAAGLKNGALSLALVTGADLAAIVSKPEGQKAFLSKLAISDDFTAGPGAKTSFSERIFVVTPLGQGCTEPNRIVVLIKCKSTVNAVKKLANSMPDRRIHIEQLPLPARASGDGRVALARVSLPRAVDGARIAGLVLSAAESAGVEISVLGAYPGSQNYGG